MKEIKEKMNNFSIPAIVLGSSITALGVMRSLGRENISIIYIAENDSYIARSRWSKNKLISTDNLSHTHHLQQLLINLPIERAVLFPCSDALLTAVASLDPTTRSRFPSSHPDLKWIQKLMDKAGLSEILTKFELPHPKTFVIKNQRDLELLKDEAFTGAFLKPRESHKFFKHYGVKAIQVENREDTMSKAQEIQHAGYTLVLQDYIPGPKSNHYFIDGFVDRFGHVKTFFARRRIRMFPPDFGNSSYMYSVPINEVSSAIETLNRLFNNINYRGIFSTEFKYDERDGLFKIIEVNVRPWWYIEFATSCGVNVCKLAYQDALGQEVRSLNGYTVGKQLVYCYYDILSYLHQHREGNIKFWSWIRSWSRATHPIFNWRDPVPAIVKSCTWFWEFVKRRFSGS